MESSETSLTPKQYAESVREHFLNSFPEHFNKMSETILGAMKEALTSDDDDILKLNTFRDNFEKSLTEEMEKQFNYVWDELNLADNIAAIRECIDKNTEKNAVKWRPTERTVCEQTRPYRIKNLEAKVQKLEEIIESQQEKLKTLFINVEEKRSALIAVAKRRDKLNYNLNIKMTEITELENDLRDKHLKLNENTLNVEKT